MQVPRVGLWLVTSHRCIRRCAGCMLCALTITGVEAAIRLETIRSQPVLIGQDIMSSAVATYSKWAHPQRARSSIDKPPKPKVGVQEAIANAKVYCKRNSESFVSLRDYSGGIYNETCAAFAAEQHVADPTYKIGSD